MKILVLNGPNLNMTGRREKEIYGTRSMDELIDELRACCEGHGAVLEHLQSNHEGALIDAIQDAPTSCDAILLNAGALTHYSYALRDAIACCPIPVGEVHMSDITKREAFRSVDVLYDVCAFRIMGYGADSYRIAVDRMLELLG